MFLRFLLLLLSCPAPTVDAFHAQQLVASRRRNSRGTIIVLPSSRSTSSNDDSDNDPNGSSDTALDGVVVVNDSSNEGYHASFRVAMDWFQQQPLESYLPKQDALAILDELLPQDTNDSSTLIDDSERLVDENWDKLMARLTDEKRSIAGKDCTFFGQIRTLFAAAAHGVYILTNVLYVCNLFSACAQKFLDPKRRKEYCNP